MKLKIFFCGFFVLTSIVMNSQQVWKYKNCDIATKYYVQRVTPMFHDSIHFSLEQRSGIDEKIIIQILQETQTLLHGGFRVLGNIGYGIFPEISQPTDRFYIKLGIGEGEHIDMNRLDTLYNGFFDIGLKLGEKILVQMNKENWFVFSVDVPQIGHTMNESPKSDRENSFVRLIGRNWEDSSIGFHTLGAAAGIKPLHFSQEISTTYVIEYRIRLIRNDLVIFSGYFKDKYFPKEVHEGLMIRAKEDQIIIDRVYVSLEGELLGLEGVNLKIVED